MASHAFAARNCEISPLEIAERALQNLPGVMLQVMAETCPKCQVQKWAEPTPRRWRHDEFTRARKSDEHVRLHSRHLLQPFVAMAA